MTRTACRSRLLGVIGAVAVVVTACGGSSALAPAMSRLYWKAESSGLLHVAVKGYDYEAGSYTLTIDGGVDIEEADAYAEAAGDSESEADCYSELDC